MKTLRFIIFLFTLHLLSGCLDELPDEGNLNYCPGIRLDDGSCPLSSKDKSIKTPGWYFNSSVNYSFNSDFIELDSTGVGLKEIYTSFKGEDFSNGTHLGTFVSGGKLKMKTNPSQNEAHANTLLPELSSNLIAFWSFNGNLNNASSSSFNGISVGDTSISSGKVSSGLSFDGDGDWVEIPFESSLEQSEGSIAFWVKTTNDSAGIVFSVSDPLSSGNFSISLGDGATTYCTDELITVLSSDSSANRICFSSPLRSLLFDDNWHHIVVTVDSSHKVKIYLDGANVGTLSGSTKLISFTDNINAGVATIGQVRANAIPTGNKEFLGQLDEMAFWNTVLSEQEIQKLYDGQKKNYTELSSDWTPHWDDVVGYWKMDGNWKDSSVQENHGIANGEASFSSDRKVGSRGGVFDGSGDFIQISDSDSLDDAAQMSWAFWYKNSAIDTTAKGILCKRIAASHQDSYCFFVSNLNDKLFIDIDSYNDRFSTNTIFEVNKWYHIIITYNGNLTPSERVSVYINGKHDITSSESSASIPDYSSDLYFGHMLSGNYLTGNLDDISIWKTALSTNEVKLIYDRQKQKYAASYLSPVIDLASSQKIREFSKTTDLPFMKELTTTSESSSDYNSLSGNLSNGLVAYWALNEESWSTSVDDVIDLSSNSFDGRITGNTISQEGILGRAASLDGDGDGFCTNDNPQLEITGEVSNFQWINLSSLPSVTGPMTLVGKWSIGANREYYFYIDTNNVLKFTKSNNGNGGGAMETIVSLKTFDETDIGKWLHIGFSINSSSELLFYLNGEELSSHNLADNNFHQGLTNFCVGRVSWSGSADGFSFHGEMDEIAFWNRALTTTEIQQLYRRGANRIKYQVRSCVDSTCSGDPEWKGPGGDRTTFFSELFNRESSEILNMFSSCDTSGDKICSEDDFSFSGSTLSLPYRFDFGNSLINNYSDLNSRYFQYRVFMESEENIACSDEACLPSLAKINFETVNKYYDISPSISSKKPIIVSKKILKVEEKYTGECSVKYQFSKNGVNFYYYKSGHWKAAIDSKNQANTADQISSTLGDFIEKGSLFVRAYLISDGSQSCELQSLTIK